MKPKFDINNFENIKNNELKFECEICTNEFTSTKKYLRRALGITSHPRKPSIKYCSRKCQTIGKMTGEYKNCENCEKSVYRSIREIKRNVNNIFFCTSSCQGTYWNKNKNFGTNRSKMEIWIEENIKSKYELDITFNDRNVLESGYEIDIYLPRLKLGFELNGIFHYEPIFGNDKLKVTQEKDISKINECASKGIELIVIDITDSKKFNEIKDKKYLDFIISKIDEYVIMTS